MVRLSYQSVIISIFLISLEALPKNILLNDGHKMPPIAFGTFGKTSEVERVASVVVWAIEAGYRHIDTAPIYFNEVQIGEAIVNVTSRGIVKRKNLFITTKLDSLSNQKAIPALKESLKKLQLEYVDLYLIHTPLNLIDRGTVPIPKSINKEHIKSNINVFDFSLKWQEIYTINEFNLSKALYNFKELDSLYNYMYGRTVKDILEEVYKM